MVEPQAPETSRPAPSADRVRRGLIRAAAAGAIVAGSVAVAGTAWAGPMMGC